MGNNIGASVGKKTICFPFEFISMDGSKCSFIKNVEGILKADLQADKSFGCKIKNCHTHAGSKVHFQDFIEAEILFHNNYYNHGFAFLTVEEIVRRIKEIHDKQPAARISKAFLIGYEGYSELYLKEVKRQLTEYKSNNLGNISCDYFIYETLSLDESWYDSSADGKKVNDGECCAQEQQSSAKSSRPARQYGNRPASSIRNLESDGKDRRTLFCSYGLKDKPGKTRLTFTDDTADCLFVYIVPINTTLSTMDKMVALFEQKCWEGKTPETLCRQLISLITIGPTNDVENLYWEIRRETNPSCHEKLVPKKERFGKLTANDEVVNFAFTESTWTYAKGSDLKEAKPESENKCICKGCYPDIFGKKLTEESPIFDVNRSSVVPMLQLGQNLPLKPINVGKARGKTPDAGKDATGTAEDAIDFDANNINLKRIWRMAEYTTHHHIYRGSNHFQFYMDAPGFLDAYADVPAEPDISVSNYLREIRKQSKPEKDDECVIYNFIVAPSHKTNAEWVNLVYSNVFSYNGDDFNKSLNGARVLYFDISKEYRSNFKAKYSDLLQSFANILGNDQAFEIRFHYVDETITTGSRFLRAADLIQSLLSAVAITEEKKKRIKLFHSVYLLYGRSSADSKAFYYRLFKETGLEDFNKLLKENFHEYASIRISNLRNFKDACTLCKLTKDYKVIRSYCGTNTMATICTDVINTHQSVKATVLSKSNGFGCNQEKKYMFLITHILNLRIRANNAPEFKKEQIKDQIAVESEDAAEDIKRILDDYYANSYSWLSTILGKSFAGNSASKDDLKKDFRKAFIKTISRPFFTFHLRKRQASFAFCLEQLDKLCNEHPQKAGKDRERDHDLIETLVKALADMNANYLIRQAPYCILSSIAENAKHSVDSILRFCAAIKKNVTLSQDSAKSLLLEHILVNGSEGDFFRDENIDVGQSDQPWLSFFKHQTVSIQSEKGKVLYLHGMEKAADRIETVKLLSLNGLMYLENNRVLVDALSDLYRKPSLTESQQYPYYLDNFASLLNINQVTLDSNFGEAYHKLLDSIVGKNKLSGLLLKEMIDRIKFINNAGSINLEIIPFVRNKKISSERKNFNKSFEFILFSSDGVNQKEFYKDRNRMILHKGTANFLDKDPDNKQLFLSKDILFLDDNIVLVRVLQNDPVAKEYQPTKTSSADSDTDNAVYFEIRNFNENSIGHWFSLKVLLSLRNAISEMIQEINLPVFIEKQLNEMLQSAITDARAMTHAKQDETMDMTFFDQNEREIYENRTFERCGIKAGLELLDGGPQLCQTEQAVLFMKRMYCRYFSLICDELLSSWYRKLIRREKNPAAPENTMPGHSLGLPFFIHDEDSPNERDCFVFWMERLFYAKFEYTLNPTGDAWRLGSFEFYCIKHGVYKKVNVQMILKNPEFGLPEMDTRFPTIRDCSFKIYTYSISGAKSLRHVVFPLIVLLVNNAVSHADADTVDIIFDIESGSIIIGNEIQGDNIQDSTVNVQDCMSIIPFIRKEQYVAVNDIESNEQKHDGMTLWTLKHLNPNHNWFSAEMNVQEKRFSIILKNAVKWVKEDGNEQNS